MDILPTAGKLRPDPGSYLISFPHYALQSAAVVPALSCNRVGWGCPPSKLTVSFGIWRRSTMSPGSVASGRIPWMWHSAVCGTNGDGEQSSQHFADPDGPRLPGLPGHFEREPEGKEITGLGGKNRLRPQPWSLHSRGGSLSKHHRPIPYLRRVPSLQRNYSASCGGLVAIAARLMACGPSRRGAPCKPSQTASMRHCRLSNPITSCSQSYRVSPIGSATNLVPWVRIWHPMDAARLARSRAIRSKPRLYRSRRL